MADLNFLQRSNPVQIVGGNESFAAKVNAREELEISDGITFGGVSGAITVGTTAIEAKVGGSRYVLRKLLTVQNNGNQPIYYGYSSAVTTASGTKLDKGEFLALQISDVAIWLIAGSNQNVRITEAR